MKVLTLSALCNTRIVLFRLPHVLTAMERSSAEVCAHQPGLLLFTGPPGRRVSWGYWFRENLITCWINILLPCFTQPNCLQVSLVRAKACSGGPRPHSLVPDLSDYVLSDTLLSGLAAWTRPLACIGLGPLQPLSFSHSVFLSPSIPLSLCLRSLWMYPLACRCVNCFHLHCGQMGSSVSVVISYAWAF